MSLEERLNRARGTRGTSSVTVQTAASTQQSQGTSEGESRSVARPQAAARRVAASSAGMLAPAVTTSRYGDLRKNLQAKVIEEINTTIGDAADHEAELDDLIRQVVFDEAAEVPRSDREVLIQEIHNEVIGLGPLEDLMTDPKITEIMVNGAKDVYIERDGRIAKTNVTFENDDHVLRILDRIVSRIGRHVDEASPLVDARLEDGSRVNAVIRPVAIKGPSITIRRFSSAPLQIADLMEHGSLSYSMSSFLEACILGKANVIVSGGTGSGKTTLLNILSAFIPDEERIVTIEDAAELQLEQNDVVMLEARPANSEGRGRISIRDLVRNSLRMRPDRIIVGEVRSAETLDMLQAMNTGHEGSLTTVHANSPRDAMSRLETMVLMGGIELPVKAIRDQISSALDIVVQQARFRDGSRKIVSISEVVGMEGSTITLQDIFVYQQEGLDAKGRVKGAFKATGIRPHILKKFNEMGVFVRDEWFS